MQFYPKFSCLQTEASSHDTIFLPPNIKNKRAIDNAKLFQVFKKHKFFVLQLPVVPSFDNFMLGNICI